MLRAESARSSPVRKPLEEPKRSEPDGSLVARARQNVLKAIEAFRRDRAHEQRVYRETMAWINQQIAADCDPTKRPPRPKRRRRPRGGAAPSPVQPGPKPIPLTDGAEAPIE